MQQLSFRENRQQTEQLKKIAVKIFNEKGISPDKTCFKCGNTHNFKLIIKIIPSGKNCDYCRIKFYPQIKRTCARCGEFKTFVGQTQELIDEINNYLEGITIDDNS